MRNFIRLTTAVLAVLMLFGGSFGVRGAEQYAPPNLSARAAVLMDEYGQILYARQAEQSLPMASTTKIMTALVALEADDPDRMIKIDPRAVGVEGSSAYLMAGEVMDLRTLLYALLLASANDAAVAIAIAIDGSVEAFARRMNRKAEELGLLGTRFVNPHGLDAEGHYTTAADLARLTLAALRNELFAQMVSTYRYSAPVNGSESTRLFVNHNRLLREYEGCIGVKTGYTKKTGRCLVTAARREEITLVAVTLGDPNDWQDHRALLDYGFSLCRPVALAGQGECEFTLPVISGDRRVLICANEQDLTLTLPDGTSAECSVELPRFVYGGIRAGDPIGRVVWRVQGKIVAELPLLAKTDISARRYPGFWERLADTIARFWQWLCKIGK